MAYLGRLLLFILVALVQKGIGQNVTVSPRVFSIETEINFILVTDDTINVFVLDLSGRTILQPCKNRPMQPGFYHHTIRFNSRPDGVYMLAFESRLHGHAFFRVIKTTPVGIDKNPSAPSFSLFPNPCTDTLHISGLQELQYCINVIDVEGNCVLEQKISPECSNISVSHLLPGVYFANIRSSTSATALKFMKN